jgi:hypothetical protein
MFYQLPLEPNYIPLLNPYDSDRPKSDPPPDLTDSDNHAIPYSVPIDAAENPSTDILKDILTDKLSFLRDVIAELKAQIAEREELKKRISDKLDQGHCLLQTYLYELDTWPRGANRSIEQRKIALEREISNLSKEMRSEKVACFRDIALLKRDLRQFQREYRNELRRVKMLGIEA